jgi:predicted phage terminase large subunit-like protein
MKAKEFNLTPAQYKMFFEHPPPSVASTRIGVFPKGRRLGATHGASIAFITWMLNGDACLWGDTINSNIDRYVGRYFVPFLRNNNIPYTWSSQKKLMTVGTGYTDFRSADRPENWEGFGYNKVFLNEAGIILNDEYLYNNAVLPMLLDHKGSMLIAAGTPKMSRGKGKLFMDLWDSVQAGEAGYFGQRFTTYDNPFIEVDQIDQLKMRIPAYERDQEVFGEFIAKGGAIVYSEWFKRYRVPPVRPDRVVQSWDTASKAKQINDPSVCTTWFEVGDKSYLIDVYREWLKYPDLKRAVNGKADQYNPDIVLIEDKSSGMALIQDLQADRDFRFPICEIVPTEDKITRMATGSLYIEGGHMYLPEKAPWLPEYESEMVRFPEVDNDDQVDSTSQYINWKTSKPYLWG